MMIHHKMETENRHELDSTEDIVVAFCICMKKAFERAPLYSEHDDERDHNTDWLSPKVSPE
jgi:hypothetical protein